MEYCLAIKKWNNATWSNMDGHRDDPTTWSKSDKGKHTISLIYGILKNDRNELIYKADTDSQTSKTNLGLLEGQGGGGEIN